MKKEIEQNSDKKDFMMFAKERIGLIPMEVKFKKLHENFIDKTLYW